MADTEQVRFLPFGGDKPEICQGFNSASGEFVGTTLKAGSLGTNPVAGGGRSRAQARIVTSHSELLDLVGGSFSLSARYGLSSGSAKLQFSSETRFNSNSTFVLATATVENAITRGRDIQVVDPGKALLGANQIDQFTRAFGDSFVRGIKTGGEFYAVMRITSESTSSQSSLATTLELEVNGLVAAGSFSGAFAKANESESTRSEFFVSYYQAAGTRQNASVTLSIDDIMQRLRDFPTIVANEPTGYLVEVATYDTLPLPIPTPVESASLELALRDASTKRIDYLTEKNDLEFARDNARFFKSVPPIAELNAAINLYTSALNRVTDHAIRLSKGLVPADQLFFDASGLEFPPEIVLDRLDSDLSAPVQIPVRSLVGMEWNDLEVPLRAHARTLAEVSAISTMQGGPPDTLGFTQETLDFVWAIRMAVDPPNYLDTLPEDQQQGYHTVVAQFPSAGLITPDSTVFLKLRPGPP